MVNKIFSCHSLTCLIFHSHFFLLHSLVCSFVKSQPKAQLASLAIKYIEMEKEVNNLAKELADTEMNEETKRKVIDLIKKGGVRTGLRIF